MKKLKQYLDISNRLFDNKLISTDKKKEFDEAIDDAIESLIRLETNLTIWTNQSHFTKNNFKLSLVEMNICLSNITTDMDNLHELFIEIIKTWQKIENVN